MASTTELALVAVKPTFKCKELNTETARIFKANAAAGAALDKAGKEMAIALYHIESKKLYKNDGCDSLKDYVARIGMDKSIAHKLATAGALYESENESVKTLAASLTYSKLNDIASAGEEAIAAAVENGDLKPDMTRKKLQDWKNKAKEEAAKAEPDKVKTLKLFDFEGKAFYSDSPAKPVKYEGMSKEGFGDGAWVNATVHGEKVTLFISDDVTQVYAFTSVKTTPKKEKAKREAKTAEYTMVEESELEAFRAWKAAQAAKVPDKVRGNEQGNA